MWRGAVRSIAWAAGALALAVTGAAAATGADGAEPAPPVAVAFSSAEVAVGVGADRVVVLRLTNDGAAPVAGVAVDLVHDPGIDATVTALPAALAAGESATATVTVSRTRAAPVQSAVVAVVTYTSGVRGTAVATLSVTTPAAPTAAAAPVSVTAAVGSAELVQYQSTDIFFTVANVSAHAQTPTSMVAEFPAFLGVTSWSADGDAISGADGRLVLPDVGELGAGDSVVVHLRVEADKPLQPGTALVVLSVRATDGTDSSTSTVVASQTLTFSVLGESGVLTVLGVPSLLFVPGLVFVLVLWALWTYVAPGKRSASVPGLAAEGKVVLWVFALLPTLSLPFLYPVVTGWFGPRRDYRRTYGLDDILYVWLMAAAMALALWLVITVARAVWRVLTVPEEGQSELRLLAVFALRPWDRTLSRESATFAGTQLVLVLRRVGEKLLISPQITYTTENLESVEIDRLTGQTGYIPGKPWRVWWFLVRNRSRALPSYTVDKLMRPTLVDADAVVPNPARQSLVSTRT